MIPPVYQTARVVRICWPIDARRLAIVTACTKDAAARRLVAAAARGDIVRLSRGIYGPPRHAK